MEAKASEPLQTFHIRPNLEAMTDLSRPAKFKAQSYVALDAHPDGEGLPMLVEYTKNGIVTVWAASEFGSQQWHFVEADLRPITFSEFVWFIHPRSGKWMSGKTRGWMAVLIHLFTLILCAGIATTSLAWAPAPLVIPALYWYMTWRNFKGLTV